MKNLSIELFGFIIGLIIGLLVGAIGVLLHIDAVGAAVLASIITGIICAKLIPWANLGKQLFTLTGFMGGGPGFSAKVFIGGPKQIPVPPKQNTQPKPPEKPKKELKKGVKVKID